MMSVPANWSELYFNFFAILCVGGWLFLIWYELTRAAEQSDHVDVAMNVVLGAGPVGLAAALLTFVILKARDGIMMTWERYREIRFEAGRERGREEGRRQLLHEINEFLTQNGGSEDREQGKQLDTLIEIKQFLSREENAELRESLRRFLVSTSEPDQERNE